MKILHIIGSLAPEAGGPTTACLALASAQANAGHQVRVMAVNWMAAGHLVQTPEMAIQRIASMSLEHYPVSWPTGWLRSTSLRRALPAAIREAEAIHIHGLYLYPCVQAGRLARRLGKPYLLRPLGTLDPVIQGRRRWRKAIADLLFNRRLIRDAALLHYTSEMEGKTAASFIGNRPHVVVPLGVTPPQPGDPERLISKFPALAGRRLLLFLGRLHEKKGLDLLVQAFIALAPRFPDWHLLIVGEGAAEAAKLRRLLDANAVQGRATFTGHLQGAERDAAFAAASLFALLSYSENFGLAVLEAAAAGLPLLLSDQVAIAPSLAQEGAAVVVPCALEAVTGALETLLADAQHRQTLAAAGPRAAAAFGWDKAAAALDVVYRELAAGNK